MTLEDSEGFQAANAPDRLAVSRWISPKYNADGSLDLHFQHASPVPDNEANWLPAPAGPFNLALRM